MMKKYVVGICDKDIDYVMCFMEFINMKEDMPLKITAFSSTEAVEEFLGKSRLNLLLLDESIKFGEINVQVLRLSEEKNSNEDAGYVYKYQSVYKIIETIVHMLDKEKKSTEWECCAYAVYSPVNSSGKTRLAKGICTCYEKSLYMGFEEYQGCDGKIYESIKYRDLYERFMYYLLSKNTMILDIVDELKDENGVRTFVSLDYMDLKEIEEQHLEWFINLIKSSDLYRRIVFDIGSGVLSDLDILNGMDKIYIPVLTDMTSQNKLISFKAVISDTRYMGLNNKIEYVEVPMADYDSREMYDFINLSGM